MLMEIKDFHFSALLSDNKERRPCIFVLMLVIVILVEKAFIKNHLNRPIFVEEVEPFLQHHPQLQS